MRKIILSLLFILVSFPALAGSSQYISQLPSVVSPSATDTLADCATNVCDSTHTTQKVTLQQLSTFIGSILPLPSLLSGDIWVGNGSNVATGVALSGDCILSNTGSITCSKTNGSSFAPSATTDTTNASNITTGTLGSGLFSPSGVTAGTYNNSTITVNAAGFVTAASSGSGTGLPNLTNNEFWLGNVSNTATAVALSGDCTTVNTGAINCTKTNGAAFAASATTDTTDATNITTGNLPAAQLPSGLSLTRTPSPAIFQLTGSVAINQILSQNSGSGANLDSQLVAATALANNNITIDAGTNGSDVGTGLIQFGTGNTGGNSINDGGNGANLVGTWSVNGSVFTSAATTAIGTSGATIPLNSGANTFSGATTFSAGITATGLSTGTQVSCLGLNASNNVVLEASACGAGGSGTPVTFVAATAGGPTAYTAASTTPSGFTNTAGYLFCGSFTTTNGASPTLNVGAAGALPIEKIVASGVVALAGGEIATGNYCFQLNSGATDWILQTQTGTGVTVLSTASANHNVTTAEWAAGQVFVVTAASQTITFPVVTSLPTNGGVTIETIPGITVSLVPNAADGINGNTINTPQTMQASTASAVVTTGTSGVNALQTALGTSGTSAANPTATAGPTAVNGSASTFMRSDAAPAVQQASSSQKGIVQCGTGTTCASGIISVSGGGGGVNYHPGYVVNNWYLPMFPNATLASGNAPVIGTTYCFPATVPQAISVNALGTRIPTGSSGGNAQLAIYNAGSWGRPSTLVINTSSMSTTTAGNITGSVASTALSAGTYWFCSQTDNTTVRFLALSEGTSAIGGSQMLGNSSIAFIANPQEAGISVTGTFGTWPTFTSGTTWTDVTIALVPLVAFEVVSVP